jgi:hypothetical protein
MTDTKNFEDVYDTSLIDEQIAKRELEDEDESQIDFTEEDYNAWYFEQKKIADGELAEFEKSKSHTFDEIVSKYSALVGLSGNSYIDATRMIFYSLIANQLKLNLFSMDSKKIDLRIPILIQLKAGHGKKNYEYFIKRTIEGLGKQYQEPTSYHPEQFVGKIIVSDHKSDPTYTTIFGTLAADFLVIDEAHALLTRKENEECLRYLRTALDPIGNNEIQKKQVNVPDEEKLKYNPDCTVLLLTQPIANVNEDLLMRGSFRRFVVLFVDTALEERMNARRNAAFLSLKEDIFNKMWESWILFNKKLLLHENLKYVCPDFSRIDDYLDDIGRNALETSQEVLEFYNTSQFTIKQNIFKMAIVRAVVEHAEGNTITINVSHINAAIRDWQAIWIPQVRWISRQLVIQSMNPLKWDEQVHSQLINILLTQPEKKMKLSELVKRFQGNNKFVSEKSALNKAYRAVEDLRKWGFVMRNGNGKDIPYMIVLIKEK